MGTDIHFVAQAKKDGKWVDVKSEYEEDRHYLLFSWLADVRNGYGFAGIPTYDPIDPISARRGLPDDFDIDGEYHATTVNDNEWSPGMKWMGDHGYSWLTGDEILAAPPPKTRRTGVITIDQFKKWDGTSAPEEWSGVVLGRASVTISNPDEIGPRTTHVRISWDSTDEVDYFVREIQRLKDEHGEVRVVFGFDS